MSILRFIAAVTVAIFFSLIRWDRPWRRASDAWRLLRASLGQPKVHPLVFQARMAACKKCPVFYAPLRTCGTPIHKADADLGCWCALEAKNRLQAASCWARDRGVTEYGWPDSLCATPHY
jgi:hypothetical protein